MDCRKGSSPANAVIQEGRELGGAGRSSFHLLVLSFTLNLSSIV